jgi:ubiquinone/menaquinone biosynthesis C-methylase UbiE
MTMLDTVDSQHWSNRTDRYDAGTTYIVGAKTLAAAQGWLRGQIKATDIALEIGCGTGIYSAVIAERAQHFTATDISAEMLARAEARLRPFPNVDLKRADAVQVPYPEAAFDLVFMGNLLHVVPAPDAILRECHRVLKPGGRLLVLDATMTGMPAIARLAMAVRYLRGFGLPPRTNRSYDIDELANLIRKSHFEIKDAQLLKQESCTLCLCAVK